MKPTKKVSDISPMGDEELEEFWEKNEPEDFEGWQEGTQIHTSAQEVDPIAS
jgi:hypothetical protein